MPLAAPVTSATLPWNAMLSLRRDPILGRRPPNFKSSRPGAEATAHGLCPRCTDGEATSFDHWYRRSDSVPEPAGAAALAALAALGRMRRGRP